MEQRAKVVPAARGRVLEVGVGTGLNLPLYDPERVERVSGLDPAPEMLRRAAMTAREARVDVDLVPAGAEEIPFPDRSFDTVVTTYTLCTIPEPVAAAREMARVLKPDGRLLFCEHGVAPEERVRRWQRRVRPVWRRVSGGCHLDRDIPGILREGGFDLGSLETYYVPGWRPATFHYRGEGRRGE